MMAPMPWSSRGRCVQAAQRALAGKIFMAVLNSRHYSCFTFKFLPTKISVK